MYRQIKLELKCSTDYKSTFCFWKHNRESGYGIVLFSIIRVARMAYGHFEIPKILFFLKLTHICSFLLNRTQSQIPFHSFERPNVFVYRSVYFSCFSNSKETKKKISIKKAPIECPLYIKYFDMTMRRHPTFCQIWDEHTIYT